MTKLFLALTLTVFFSCLVFASDAVVSDQQREAYIRSGQVWSQPSWLSDDFKFSESLDVLRGPLVEGEDRLLLEKTVYCKMTPDTTAVNGTGKTAKFFCQLMQLDPTTKKYVVIPNVKLQKIKVKYGVAPEGGVNNGEIFGEILGTRLLWSLGFNADRMFFVDNVYCYGCGADPFREQAVDQQTLENPRLFVTAAVERKEPGSEIIALKEVKRPVYPAGGKGPPKLVNETVELAGWSFPELMTLVSQDPEVAAKQLVQRDALRLLAVFMQHVDNKEDNNRLGCTGKVDANGVCNGDIHLTVQDVGTTFGKGFNLLKLKLIKTNLSAWASEPIWKDAATCAGNIDYMAVQTLKTPHISEAGRQFLLALLDGFSAGDQGRQRVRNLFEAAQIERRDGTVDAWTQVFYEKVEQIRHPLGAANSNFTCPVQTTL